MNKLVTFSSENYESLYDLDDKINEFFKKNKEIKVINISRSTDSGSTYITHYVSICYID